MSKRNLFILIGIGILAIAAVAFLFLGRTEKSSISVPVENQPSGSTPAELPTGKENSQQNAKEIKMNIESTESIPASQQAIKEGIDTVELKNAQGNKFPLDDFEIATGIVINKQLKELLDSKDYDMYYCPANGTEKDYAVYFGYDVSRAYVDLYPDTVEWMKSWEKALLSNLHPVLFPNINFSEQELNQSLEFKDGKFRYAEIVLPGSKKGSINYRVSDNGVIISASSACMEKLVGIYEPFQP